MNYAVITVLSAATAISAVIGIIIALNIKKRKRRKLNISQNIKFGQITADGIQDNYDISITLNSGKKYSFHVKDNIICSHKKDSNEYTDYKF